MGRGLAQLPSTQSVLGKRSDLGPRVDRGEFFWATGIEDTFITDPWTKTGRTLDEYELTHHYKNWEADLKLMTELNVSAARYGIPWYRSNPAPGSYDWSFADKTLDRLLEHRIDPIVDIVHYGTPDWLKDSFLHPDYPKYVSEYAAELARRFKGRVHWYTPLNEPRITAWYCGRIGWWPPYQRNWSGYCAVLIAVCKGIVLTCKALREADPEIVLAHVDPTDLYFTYDRTLDEDVKLRQQLVFLALDLVSGTVDERHPLWAWLLRHKVKEADLHWFLEQNGREGANERGESLVDILGLNMYPMFSWKRAIRTSRGVRMRLEYAPGHILEQICEMYYSRYKVPLFISETAAWGNARRRSKWMHESVDAIRSARSRGCPVLGYTWWPMFSLFAWSYRQNEREMSRYLLNMGLWDLDINQKLARARTPLVDEYAKYADSGAEKVGALAGVASMQQRVEGGSQLVPGAAR